MTPLERLRALAYDPDVTPAQICRAARGGDALAKAYAAELLRRVRWPEVRLPATGYGDAGAGHGYGCGDGDGTHADNAKGYGFGDSSHSVRGAGTGTGTHDGDGAGDGDSRGDGFGDGGDVTIYGNPDAAELRRVEIDYLADYQIADEPSA